MFWNDLLTLGLNFGGVKEDSFCSLLDTALPRAPGVNKGDTCSTQDYLFYELHYSLVMSNLKYCFPTNCILYVHLFNSKGL